MDGYSSAPWWSRPAALAAVTLLAGATLGACGGVSEPAVSAAGTALQQSCAAVAAVLGNGPDPGEDPLGYAEAQILPLRTVGTTGTAMHREVVALSDAYGQFESTNGSAAAASAVERASARLDATCPGATS
jgi:hypothetical protein